MSWCEEVQGVHGTGKINEALLNFCALNEVTITNTFFEKKAIHKNTWQHPGSKKWHCIDYLIMRQSQRRLCADDSVLRCANCSADYKLLVAKVQLHIPLKLPSKKIRGQYAIAGLRGSAVRMKFSEAVMDDVSREWSMEDGGWNEMEGIGGSNDEGSGGSSWAGETTPTTLVLREYWPVGGAHHSVQNCFQCGSEHGAIETSRGM